MQSAFARGRRLSSVRPVPRGGRSGGPSVLRRPAARGMLGGAAVVRIVAAGRPGMRSVSRPVTWAHQLTRHSSGPAPRAAEFGR